MIDPLLRTFENLVLHFSWRRLFSLFVIVAVIISAIWVFEWYTSSLYLFKLEKITGILNKIQNIDTNIKSDQTMVKEICSDILIQLKNSTKIKAIAIYPPSTSIKKVFMAFLPWLIFGLVYIPSLRKKEPNAFAGLVGVLFFGVISVIISIYLPQAGSWFNYIIYPWAFFIIVVFSVVIWSKRKNKPK